jgi:ATP-dependent protease HslVU (ClpYQ) peptidase subunit
MNALDGYRAFLEFSLEDFEEILTQQREDATRAILTELEKDEPSVTYLKEVRARMFILNLLPQLIRDRVEELENAH